MFKQISITGFCLFITFFCLFYQANFAQVVTPTPTPTPTSDSKDIENEVVKIETSLIQTSVNVFEENGKIVDNLDQKDFELKVDGKPVKISFFESVFDKRTTASNLLNNKSNNANSEIVTSNNERGRTILFVVDDLHLSFESHKRARDLINNFIDNDLKPNDLMAIVSTTGKIGFLQQYTDDKMVLKMAVERLIYNRNYSATDRQTPRMSEYEALLIDRLDPEVTNYFAQLIVRENPGSSLESAKAQARSRAIGILFQASTFTNQSISTLDQAIRRSAQFSGRKTVFFLSDGFLLDQSNSDNNYRLQKVIDAASRSNAVIYSFDVKGLEAGLPEGDNQGTGSQRAYRVQAGERFEVQDGMSSLAENTGGRFTYNTNDLKTPASKAIVESSGYYLLAWEPEAENVKREKLKKIEVSVKGRPKLKVRLQNGYFSQTTEKEADKVKGTKPDTLPSTEDSQFNRALNSQVLERSLPTSMVLNYLDLPNEGAKLSASLQIKSDFLDYTQESNQSYAKVDFQGVVYNSEGKREGFFKDRITVSYQPQNSNVSAAPDLFYNLQLNLKPGLYQVRVVSKDVKSGKIGNAIKWINIPDLGAKKLAVSSLLIGEREKNEKQTLLTNLSEPTIQNSEISVDRVFKRTSFLRYLIFIYNAKKRDSENGMPEVTIKTRLFQGGKLILDGQIRQIPTEQQDLERLFYAAEIPLESLLSGNYEIQLLIQDKISKNSTTQSVRFQIK